MHTSSISMCSSACMCVRMCYVHVLTDTSIIELILPKKSLLYTPSSHLIWRNNVACFCCGVGSPLSKHNNLTFFLQYHLWENLPYDPSHSASTLKCTPLFILVSSYLVVKNPTQLYPTCTCICTCTCILYNIATLGLTDRV